MFVCFCFCFFVPVLLVSLRITQTKLLVVTDVAARGIDVPLLNNVINYAFPPAPKLFVHRVGRAARQGRTGTVRTDCVKSSRVSPSTTLSLKVLGCWEL